MTEDKGSSPGPSKVLGYTGQIMRPLEAYKTSIVSMNTGLADSNRNTIFIFSIVFQREGGREGDQTS